MIDQAHADNLLVDAAVNNATPPSPAARGRLAWMHG
jgi:hypothetical protein